MPHQFTRAFRAIVIAAAIAVGHLGAPSALADDLRYILIDVTDSMLALTVGPPAGTNRWQRAVGLAHNELHVLADFPLAATTKVKVAHFDSVRGVVVTTVGGYVPIPNFVARLGVATTILFGTALPLNVGGGTNLADAICAATSDLSNEPPGAGAVTRELYLYTDGGENASLANYGAASICNACNALPTVWNEICLAPLGWPAGCPVDNTGAGVSFGVGLLGCSRLQSCMLCEIAAFPPAGFARVQINASFLGFTLGRNTLDDSAQNLLGENTDLAAAGAANPDSAFLAAMVDESGGGYEFFDDNEPVEGPVEIPTVSEWGLITLGCSLLVIGAYVLRRQERLRLRVA